MAILWPSHQTETHSQTQGWDHSHDKALQEARELHTSRASEAAHMLELNIERLNKEADGARNANTPAATAAAAG